MTSFNFIFAQANFSHEAVYEYAHPIESLVNVPLWSIPAAFLIAIILVARVWIGIQSVRRQESKQAAARSQIRKAIDMAARKRRENPESSSNTDQA